jgi:WD40 repeat protein
MSALRHVRSVLRFRRLLAAGVFVFLAYVFANNMQPRPRYVVQTGAALRPFLEPSEKSCITPRTTVYHVSDDGCQVIVGVSGGPYLLQLWDARAGIDRTPVHWTDARCSQFLIAGDESELERFLADPEGRAFVLDAEAWVTLDKRWAPFRTATGRLYPDGLSFSPDGRLISYVVRGRLPGLDGAETVVFSTIVDDVRTGSQVATLPGVKYPLTVAPGGRTVVSWDFPEDRQGEQPWLTLWNLETSTRRATLMCPQQPEQIEYSPDGRYVLARQFFPSDPLRWWDANTGKLAGEIYTSSRPNFLDSSRMLAIASRDNQTLHFWDAATGRTLDDWDFEPREDGLIAKMTFSGDRYVLAQVYPDYRSTGSRSFPALDRVVSWLSEHVSDGNSRDRSQILALDAIDRRALGQVRGVCGSVSSNGQWLATLDADGVVRVWELPVRRPWARGFAYSAAVMGGWWLVVALRRRLRRKAGVPDTMSPLPE